MKRKHKLIIKAKVTKHIIEYYELDCTGMDIDDVKAEMEEAYIEDREGWKYVFTESDGSEIDHTIEIV